MSYACPSGGCIRRFEWALFALSATSAVDFELAASGSTSSWRRGKLVSACRRAPSHRVRRSDNERLGLQRFKTATRPAWHCSAKGVLGEPLQATGSTGPNSTRANALRYLGNQVGA